MPDATSLNGHLSPSGASLHANSLTLLPTEILAEIVSWLTHHSLDLTKENPYQKAHTPAYCFRPNHLFSNLTRSYHDIVALSSTCSSFRLFLGPIIFRYLSLIRVSEFDALLASPRTFERFSDSKKYQDEYFKGLFNVNTEGCGAPAPALTPLGTSMKEDSRYREYSANNYVEVVEVNNDLLLNPKMSLFGNIRALKVLDRAYRPQQGPVSGEEPQIGPIFHDKVQPECPIYFKKGQNNRLVTLPYLRFLSVNISTLVGLETLLLHIPQLHRLDLLCEFNTLDSEFLGRFSSLLSTLPRNNLVEFNLFVSASAALRYKAVLDLLEVLFYQNLTICSINIRLIRRNTVPEVKTSWEIYDREDMGQYSGKRLIEVLASCPNLQNVGLDLPLLRLLSFPLVPEEFLSLERANSLCCTFIDRTVNLPTFERGPIASMAYVITSLQAERVCFQYGETAEGSRLHALTLMRTLVAFLRTPLDQSQAYLGVRTVALEKAWSMVQENAERDEYYELLQSYDKTHSQDDYRAILKASTTDRYSMHVPAYRVREVFEAGSTLVYLPGARENEKYSGSQAFWSVEASLCEMEQYCLTPKPKSGLWDGV